ncbi:autophagy protein 16, interacts with Atg12p-Atg5p [Exophiala xenobiotica]|uniref:Autophagy protein 16, interacts with Atg12p-Atg5p n=1 Tax=Lithohypha guttulata TaxID=1690604 RepID=A0ABR0KFD8_9EURO|nr:autophagy protein 16, interacts with Atg12p-Atg5p [Lithohypha guttulata]KAK5314453.1 autophagy protein 16, interacts with Atg12p-Atg5p [Exophiala xenobiotica]
MADWKAHYLSALKARDEVEQADAEIYYKCTRLADRNAELRAEVRRLKAATTAETPASNPVPAPLISYGFRRQTSPQPVSDSDATIQLRQGFAKAQQDRADLHSQLESVKRELEAVMTKGRSDGKKIAQLTSSVTQLSTKLRDREEELRGKAKLLVNVQDENATLNLELNQAEQEVKRVKKENQELVERWVARMGKEAEKMNEESKFS